MINRSSGSIKVKTFSQFTNNNMEKDINEWLSKNEVTVLDIQYGSAGLENDVLHTTFITYDINQYITTIDSNGLRYAPIKSSDPNVMLCNGLIENK